MLKSRLARARGLKHEGDIFEIVAHPVAPRKGARIETITFSREALSYLVAPRKGARIETSLSSNSISVIISRASQGRAD